MTPEQDNTRDAQTQGLSPALLLNQLESLLKHLGSKWLLIVAGSICFGLAGWILSLREDTVYQAELSFALDEKEPENAQSTFSLFSQQLGLEPINGGNAFSNLRNIEELLKSRLMIEKTLFSYYVSGKDSLLFVDFFLDSLDFRNKWAPGTEAGDIKAPSRNRAAASSREEQVLIKSIYRKISGAYLGIQQKTKGTSILTVSLTSPHEGFSKHFLERLVDEVSAYYIDAKTRRSKTNLSIIAQRNDSIRLAYQQAVRTRASFADADINLVREIAAAPSEKMQTDVQILRSAYIELSRNLETAKTALMNETPIIEIIDLPLLPLDKKSPTPLRSFLLFAILGAALTTLWLSAKWALSLLRGEQPRETEDYPEYT
jgi:hypothetical protein